MEKREREREHGDRGIVYRSVRIIDIRFMQMRPFPAVRQMCALRHRERDLDILCSHINILFFVYSLASVYMQFVIIFCQ